MSVEVRYRFIRTDREISVKKLEEVKSGDGEGNGKPDDEGVLIMRGNNEIVVVSIFMGDRVEDRLEKREEALAMLEKDFPGRDVWGLYIR